ncbi:MAG: hypothetical protein JWO05_3035 [Gemmatimonadetes bacterium]|nr:hypothetical protein [Gemmatimonadota bacterium]
MAGQSPISPVSEKRWAAAGVGCMSILVGFFGCGMLGVAVGWAVGLVQRCKPAPNTFPICNIDPYWKTGVLLGVTLFPAFMVWRVLSARRPDPTNEGESGVSR